MFSSSCCFNGHSFEFFNFKFPGISIIIILVLNIIEKVSFFDKFSMRTLKSTPFPHRSLLIFLLSVILYNNTDGQAGVSISKPQLRLEKDNLIIKYGILSGKPDDKFNVNLRITDSTGTLISANSLSGDIGDSIGAGREKEIVWNLAADQIYINMGIFVEIRAEKLIMPSVVPAVEKTDEAVAVNKPYDDGIKGDQKESIPVVESKAKPVHSAETGKNLLRSAVIPGWGLTSLSDGKPYWIIAVVDAGCVATSVYYNKKASSNYSKYQKSSDATEFDTYFEDASKQHTLSRVFGWSAVGIWVADMCLVGIKTIHVNTSSKGNKMSYLKIGGYFDSNASAACLSVNFCF